MLTGVEYVIAAYVIWISTFAVYILMTKRKMRNANQTVEAIKQRISDSSENPEKKGSIEN